MDIAQPKPTLHMPVQAAPRDPDIPADTPPAVLEQPKEDIAPKRQAKSVKSPNQSVTGIAAVTVIVTIALASLTIVVYLKS